MVVKVRRYDPETNAARLDTFTLEPEPGMTVLGALFRIQERLDPTLSFRYSCRGAVCGSCAMLINKVPCLACRTQVTALAGGEVLVEPLPDLPVLKDLVVDMTRFFDHWRAVEPALKPAAPAPGREYPMTPAEVAKLEPYTNCILCAACYAACPVNGERADYLGPAALARLWRFCLDPREGNGDARLLIADRPEGWWACRFHANCREVCPRGVPPNLAIGQARARLARLGRKPPAGAGAD
ncbi:MAG: succinate dehydrogenase/fumarate reductase iron-sulfur subunit [bacterium]